MAGIRRRLVLLAALASSSVVACGRPGGSTQTWQAPELPPGSSPPATETLPRVTPYVVADEEPAPDVKRSAVHFIEVLTNYPDGGGTPEMARARLAPIGVRPELADQAGPLLSHDAACAGEIVYPQLGGLTDTTASVMAVVNVHVRRNGVVRSSVRTLDLRLSRTATTWTVSAIAYNGGEPAPSPDSSAAGGGSPSGSLPRVAADVLASNRIELSDTSRADVLAGRTDTRILQLLLEISARRHIAVTVLSSGHPHEVFGTNRVSNHTRGRAADIWAVDGRPVAEQRAGSASPAREVTMQSLAAGASEVGAPWVLSAGGQTSFTNTVHQDHIHIGLDR